MHDIVIRGGRIFDGTGAPEFAGDIGIDGDRIVAVGADVGAGRREIDAAGHVVAPGWIDIHTHMELTVTVLAGEGSGDNTQAWKTMLATVEEANAWG